MELFTKFVNKALGEIHVKEHFVVDYGYYQRNIDGVGKRLQTI